jgi:terminase small subunit-like protein
MAGTPIQNNLLADIEAVGGWDTVFERIASGETQTAIAKSFGVSQGFFSRVIHLDLARAQAFRDAKRQAATHYAEQAMALADGVEPDRDQVAKVREQVSVRKWLAASWDRPQYGEAQPDINVNVLNLGQLHLEALRHRSVDESPQLPPERPALPDEDTTFGDGGSGSLGDIP